MRSSPQRCRAFCTMYVRLSFFFQAEDGIRDLTVTGVQTCALPISSEDVRSFADGRGAAAPAGLQPLSQVARLMAERTTQSWTSVPHFFLVRYVDCGDRKSVV